MAGIHDFADGGGIGAENAAQSGDGEGLPGFGPRQHRNIDANFLIQIEDHVLRVREEAGCVNFETVGARIEQGD